MGIYDNWTYTDLHQLNLDWILKEIKKLNDKVSNIDENIENIILSMIADGTLVIDLETVYDADTESLTIRLIGE